MPDNETAEDRRNRLYDEGMATAEPVWPPNHTTAEAIAQCGLCDADGYRNTVVCDHQQRDTSAGRQAARDALAQIRHRKASAS